MLTECPHNSEHTKPHRTPDLTEKLLVAEFLMKYSLSVELNDIKTHS